MTWHTHDTPGCTVRHDHDLESHYEGDAFLGHPEALPVAPTCGVSPTASARHLEGAQMHWCRLPDGRLGLLWGEKHDPA